MDQDQQEKYDAAERIRQIEAARLQHSPNQPSEVKQIVPQDPVAEPQATTIFTVTGTCFSKGNSAVSFRAPDARVFMTPDSAVVITGMFPGYFDQFAVGQTYTITIGTP